MAVAIDDPEIAMAEACDVASCVGVFEHCMSSIPPLSAADIDTRLPSSHRARTLPGFVGGLGGTRDGGPMVAARGGAHRPGDAAGERRQHEGPGARRR